MSFVDIIVIINVQFWVLWDSGHRGNKANCKQT